MRMEVGHTADGKYEKDRFQSKKKNGGRCYSVQCSGVSTFILPKYRGVRTDAMQSGSVCASQYIEPTCRQTRDVRVVRNRSGWGRVSDKCKRLARFSQTRLVGSTETLRTIHLHGAARARFNSPPNHRVSGDWINFDDGHASDAF